ncbi:MAG TPA: hypothetical protein VGG77_04420 [Roseiarcus sp.]|jgi:hypothetical protein
MALLLALFPGFDPSLGTLTSVDELVTGKGLWGPNADEDVLLTMRMERSLAMERFSATSNNVQMIDISLSGTNLEGFPGPGLIDETLFVTETSAITGQPVFDGVLLFHGALNGTVTYFYTPRLGSAIPEPSTWVELLVGFSALGFAGYCRAKPRQL